MSLRTAYHYVVFHLRLFREYKLFSNIDDCAWSAQRAFIETSYYHHSYKSVSDIKKTLVSLEKDDKPNSSIQSGGLIFYKGWYGHRR